MESRVKSLKPQYSTGNLGINFRKLVSVTRVSLHVTNTLMVPLQELSVPSNYSRVTTEANTDGEPLGYDNGGRTKHVVCRTKPLKRLSSTLVWEVPVVKKLNKGILHTTHPTATR